MSPVRLLLLVLALAAIAGGLWYALGVLDDAPPPPLPMPERAERSLIALEPDALARLTLHFPRTNAIVRLERGEDHAWSLSEPLRDSAEPAAVFSALNTLYAQDWAEAPADWDGRPAADLGLEPAECAVEIADEHGVSQRLRIGAQEYSGRWRAAELDGRRIRLGEGVVSPLLRDLSSWRDHRILPVAPPAVVRIRWQPAEGPALELERRESRWQIVAPFDAPLDERQAPFIERMLGARAVLLRQAPLAQQPPEGELLGRLEARDARSHWTLELHELGLRAGHRDFAIEWQGEDYEILFRDPETLRSPRLLALDPGRIASIRIERGTASGVFRRAAGGWALDGFGPLPAAEGGFLDALLERAARIEGGEWREAPRTPPSGRALFSISRTPREGVPTLQWWQGADGVTLAGSAGAARATPTDVNFDGAMGELFERLAALGARN